MKAQTTVSFKEIYSTFYRKSYLYIKSYVHDDLVAEDIVSDSLIKLWEQLKKDTIYPIGPYLFSMLKNRALDHLKHLSVKREVHGVMAKAMERELEIRTASLELSDPKEIFSDEIQHLIDTTLQSLPGRTKEIFILSRFRSKSHKEIAELHQITVKGVEYHIAQAISRLRITLKDYLPIID